MLLSHHLPYVKKIDFSIHNSLSLYRFFDFLYIYSLPLFTNGYVL